MSSVPEQAPDPTTVARVAEHRRRFEQRATPSQRAQLAALWPTVEA